MLVGFFDYIRRNANNWKSYELRKTLKEVNQAKQLLERKIREMEGGDQYVG
ncbi:hypothetical protein [Bacillus sp. UMB0728]|uniref:hypothetical protein n=1 Tax=Bacillus sp. UMB0728 TaxID=2066052 RepID=UPI0015DF5A14|nr:hypothetical protein [Bacillus sp. UMB0728]